jgi:glycosyltransferase involved in cell wall biosynthesis
MSMTGATAIPDGVRVSVILPTLNEARNLPRVFAALPPGIFEVLLIDGHSTDGTVEAARRLYPSIRVIYQDGRGKGNALRCGFAACRGEIAVTLDADGSADGGEVPRFVAALLAGADLAKGSRFLGSGGSDDLTLLRRAGNRALTILVNLLFRTRFTDLCYGMNAFWMHCLPALALDCDGFEIEALLALRCRRARLRVTEVASFEHRRLYGASNLRALRDGGRVFGIIVRERLMGAGGARVALGAAPGDVEVA